MIFLGELRLEAVRENLRTLSCYFHGLGQRLGHDGGGGDRGRLMPNRLPE
jgi:hypothetical protein